jgi:Holliday junction resolvasome RuvABC ATP-dependent DNA helicase subunit
MNHYTSFDEIIGQEPHKLYFDNLLGANKRSKTPKPPLVVSGERGAGKTSILRALIRAMQENHPDIAILPQPESDSLDTLPTPKLLRGENGDQSAMRSFLNDLSVMLGNNLPLVVVLDEFHELDKGPRFTPASYGHLFTLLMKITLFSLEGRSGTIQIEENHYTWDPSKHFLLFATNYPEKVNPALWSRCRHVALSAFTPEELTAILMQKLKAKGYRAVEGSIKPIVNLCRTSAREIDNVLGELASVIGNQGKVTINKEDVLMAMRGMEKYPYGFVKDFVRLLDALQENVYNEPTMQTLRPSIADTIRQELSIAADHKLIYKPSSRGWQATSHCKEALKAWKAQGFKW